MRLRNITLAGIILLMLAFVISPVNAETDNATTEKNSSDEVAAGDVEQQLVDDIVPDDSIIGPDSVFYGFTIALDNMDVTFTFNETEKIEKQIAKAEKRLAELKAALKNKNIKAADIAIEQYREENEKANESISKLKTKNGGLIKAQAEIAKHEYVLEGLIKSHPNNTGLQRAYNHSKDLQDEFASKTKVKLERKTDKMGRKTLKHVKVEDDESGEYEKTSIKASVEDNKTHVKVELKFQTNSTEPADIAADISDRVAAIKNNVSGLIKIERNERDGEVNDEKDNEKDDDEAEPVVTVTGGQTATLTTTRAVTSTATLSREKLKAQAQVKGNTTRVNFEYTFFLNVTEDPAIITGVEGKLSTLTDEKILNALDVKVKEKREDIKETKRDEKKKVEIKEKKQENRNTRIDSERSNRSEEDEQDR
ncbi:MAG: DUF5667 domain-containing protein [Candidatus Methanoperedenaceae archaeon]|nr:DUF5667 domain-containing protein [Candidatus Methanoperedenaceae archaeon]